jgi:uncharacterized damage-inducible protein DinB
MDLLNHCRILATYNRLANERLYAQCAQLDNEEYRKRRQGSFESIHGLLNHILLGDGIWMSRFEGGGQTTPPLGTILYDDFGELRSARTAEDERIERFFTGAEASFFEKTLRYTNSKGQACADSAAMAVAHFFNHQTHHRGQVHIMLSQTPIPPPSLDLHRLMNPV